MVIKVTKDVTEFNKLWRNKAKIQKKKTQKKKNTFGPWLEAPPRGVAWMHFLTFIEK